MNIRELRIGNLVEYFNELHEITAIASFDGEFGKVTLRKDNEYLDVNIGHIEPTEITAEWLKKVGFEGKVVLDHKELLLKSYSKLINYKIFVSVLFENGEFNSVSVLFDDGYDEYSYRDLEHIQYVHELQNLIHALTGEKLEITP